MAVLVHGCLFKHLRQQVGLLTWLVTAFAQPRARNVAHTGCVLSRFPTFSCLQLLCYCVVLVRVMASMEVGLESVVLTYSAVVRLHRQLLEGMSMALAGSCDIC